MLKVINCPGSHILNFTKREGKQFEELLNLLCKKYEESNELVFVFVNYEVGKQVDVILLKNNAIIIIEMKGYPGEIIGGTSGEWKARRKDGREIIINKDDENPFHQVKTQRNKLIDILYEKLPLIIPDFSCSMNEIRRYVSGWLYFLADSTYDLNQVQEEYRWFNVVTPSDIIEKIGDERFHEFLFSDKDMENIQREIFPGTLINLRKRLKFEKPVPVNNQEQLMKSEDEKIIFDRLSKELIKINVRADNVKKITSKIIKELKKIRGRTWDIDKIVKKIIIKINELEKSNVQAKDIDEIVKKAINEVKLDIDKAVDEVINIKTSVQEKLEDSNKTINASLEETKKSIGVIDKKLDEYKKRRFPKKTFIVLCIVVILVLTSVFLCGKIEEISNNLFNHISDVSGQIKDWREWMLSNESFIELTPSYPGYPSGNTIVWTVNKTEGQPVLISNLAWVLLENSTSNNIIGGATANISDNDANDFLTPGDTITVTTLTEKNYEFILADKTSGIVFKNY